MLHLIGVLRHDASDLNANTAKAHASNVQHTHIKQTSTLKTTLLNGHHTLGIECKGVLSTGVDRMLVGNRVGVGLTRSTISSFAPI